MADTKPKAKGYQNRGALDAIIPIELDSDPDFNPGPVVEVKPEKKKRQSASNRQKPRSSTASKGTPATPRTRSSPVHDSSDEEGTIFCPPKNVKRRRASCSRGTPKKQQIKSSVSTQADTETEDDEDDKDIYFNPIRANIQKRTSLEPAVVADKDTTTEESDEDKMSTTEDESEEEFIFPIDPNSHPRPGFPLAPDQKVLNALVLDGSQGIMIPAPLNTYLRPYQRDGARFFWEQYKKGLGALLGDDMGLGTTASPFREIISLFTGKTIQVISFLSAIMHKTGLEEDKDRRRNHVSDLMDQDDWLEDRKLPPANATWPTCLIIAPSTVALNWQREFETWGYFEVGLYTGSRKSRQPVLEDFKKGRLDVVITSFELAMRDIDLLSDLAWSAIIIDEVHRVKNETAKSTKAYHKFSCLRRFGLTGTAIQNSYDEFHAILHWTNPGRFEKKKDWRAKVSGPLAAGQSSTATDEQRAKGLEIAMELKCKILPGYFLRRTKDLIKHQLPKKNDQVVFCPLTPIQIKLYKVILKLPLVQALIHKDDPCECGREPEKPTRKCCYDYKTILQPALFRYIWALIKLSNHVALILPHPDDNPEQQKRNRQLTAEAFPDTEAPTYGPTILQSRYCGKWDVLAKLLSKWREDPTNKVLIFTKSVKLLDMLEFHVKQLGYGYKRLDGKVKQDDRMGIIDEFNFNPETFVFLISTLAGGTGLNLTGANKVVIFDPNWNPAHDLQAMDRAFRIGQKRDVDVYRLLGAGSIEELVYACQVYKQQQMAIGYDASIQTRYFEAVKGDTSKKGELFGIKNIFRLHEGPLVTKMAIEKANIAQFEWGLANMKGGGKSGTSAKTDVDGGEKEEDLHGIEDLLFNEGPVPQLEVEEGEIQKLLSEAGIMYSHRNDHILQPSRIEEQRAKVTLEKTRKRKRESNKKRSESSEEEEAKPQWPPIRKHKQSVLDPAQQLADRRAALLEIGFINTMAQFHDFGKRFASETRAEQDRILKELDDYSANKQAAATADSDVDMSD